MPVIQIQTDFTHGELSPLMRSRYDTRLYLKACERLTNMLVLVQGAATRRFGLDFIEDLNVPSNGYQLFAFDSQEGDNFLLMLTNLELRIFNSDGTQHPSSPIAFPYPGAALINSEVKFSQTHDEALFTHPTFGIKPIEFNAGTNVFTTGTFVFKNAPTFDFQDEDYSNINFLVSEVEVFKGALIVATSPVFTFEHVGGIFISSGTTADSPVGLARLTKLISSIEMELTIINAFNKNISTEGAPGKDSILEKVAISVTRGFPRSVAFYENRLIFGGSKSLPQTIFMSQIADYTDFSPGSGNDEDAIIATISSNQSSAINDVIADKTIQVFTDSGEFSPPQLEEDSLTPTGISIRKQSSIGNDKRVVPVTIDNATFYIQKGGRSVYAYFYENTTASYASAPSSSVSEHLISDVIDMTTLKARSDSDSNYLFLVNGGVVKRVNETLPAGTLIAFQTLASQNIQAWSPQVTTNGKFKRVQSVGNTLFCIIERVINGSPLQYLEKANFDKLTDSNLTFSFATPQTTVGGLSHLEGNTVDIIADGFVVTPAVVSGGTVTVENAAKEFEIGLTIKTEVKTMPINVTGDSGPTLPIPQRIPRDFIDLLNSQGVEVNGVLIPNLLFSEEFIEGPLPLRTGLFEISNLDGWDRRQGVSITQNGAFPLTLLSIGYEVDL